MKRLKSLFEFFKRIGMRQRIFGSVFGASFAIIVLVILLGTPVAAHASVWSWLGGLVSKVGDATLGAIFEGTCYIILSFASFILWLVGVFFNTIVDKTILTFGAFLGGNAGIIAGWTVIRDVCNIALLFGFIFLGITTILDIQQYEVKKTLPRLLIFAILLNFSLLASQAVIDVSNILATQLYKQASTDCTSTGNDSTKTCANQGISGKVITASGLSTILDYDDGTGTAVNKENSNAADANASNTKWGIIYLGMAIFVIITAVVLLAGAIMLLTRAIMLSILMVLSPIGFAAFAIPPLEKYAKKWWDTLLSQAFFAPVYLLLIFIGLKIASVAAGGKVGSLAVALAGNASGIDVTIVFGLIIGFMVVALMMGKTMGIMGAQFATKIAGGAIVGGMAFAGRRTIGRVSSWGAEKLNKTAIGRTTLGQIGIRGLNYGAAASFDARAGGLAGVGGIDFGKAQKGGYTEILKQAEKRRTEASKQLRNTDDEKRAMDEAEAQMSVIDNQIADEKERGKRGLATLDATQKSERQPLENEIMQQRQKVNGVAGTPEEAKEVQKLNALLLTMQGVREDQAKERAKLQETQKQTVDALTERKTDYERILKANAQAPLSEYAENLKKELPPVLRQLYEFSAGPRADRHIAGAILKDLKKTETQKMLEGLNAFNMNVAAQEGRVAAPSPPPRTPPAGGGAAV